jgi:alkylation response protein AidB-like acyl-CoA dehydrogenase
MPSPTWDNTTLFVDDDPADRAFRQEVRDWIGKNLPADLCNRSARIDPPELKPWHRKLYERGWIAPHWPKEVGGMGATLTQQIILFEEISRVGAPTPYPHGLNFIGPLIIDAGTPEQKRKHLPPILTGEITWCQGYSEAGAGSDLVRLETRAELEGDHFVVNGHKMWTTNGHFANWMFALVRTDRNATPRHAGISMLLIDLKSPGITVRPIQTIKGDAEFAEELLVDVRVPRENLLGGLNDGWKVANRLLGSERFTTGHPRNAAVLLNKARQVAELTGATREAGFLHRLAALEIDLMAFSAYYRHARRVAR